MSDVKYQASATDGKEILRILESSAAKGSIELIYTRRPDAYASYMKESGEARVFVSKDEERTIGTCAEIVRDVYIGGEIHKAAYICGLKKDAVYNGSIGFGAEFIRELRRDDIDFYYCSVVSDNTVTQKMFAKSRRIVAMKPIATYKTYILNPKVKLKSPRHSFIFRQATIQDIPRLLEFLNTQGKMKDLFPVIHSFDDYYNLSYKDFFLLMDRDRIIATGALWNQTDYKQYVVKKYRKLMKIARIANPLFSLLGYIKLPCENEPLAFPMLSFFLSRDDSEEFYRIFLCKIMGEIAKSYDMFVIGLAQNHFAVPTIDKLPSIHFETKLYRVSFPWSNQNYKEVDSRMIYPECALL